MSLATLDEFLADYNDNSKKKQVTRRNFPLNNAFSTSPISEVSHFKDSFILTLKYAILILMLLVNQKCQKTCNIQRNANFKMSKKLMFDFIYFKNALKINEYIRQNIMPSYIILC